MPCCIYWVFYYYFGSQSLQLCVGAVLHTMLTNMEEKVQGTLSEPNRLDSWGWTHPVVHILLTVTSVYCPLFKSFLKQEAVPLLCTWHHFNSLSNGSGDFWHEMATVRRRHNPGAASAQTDQGSLCQGLIFRPGKDLEWIYIEDGVLFHLCDVIFFIYFSRINKSPVAVESTVPCRSLKKPSRHTPLVFNTTSPFVTTLRA